MITSLHRIHTKDKLEFFGVLYLPDGNRPEAEVVLWTKGFVWNKTADFYSYRRKGRLFNGSD